MRSEPVASHFNYLLPVTLNQAVFGLSTGRCSCDVDVFLVKEFSNITSNNLFIKISVEFSNILLFDLGNEFSHG